MSSSPFTAVRQMTRLAAGVLVLVVAAGYAVATPQPSGDSASKPGRKKPTIVLVHGAWADASSWTGEVQRLQQQGYTVRAVPNPILDLSSDARFVADFLKTIKGPIVLVGHSYGGAVITNAAAEVKNVQALVYVDAITPDVGEGNISLIGDASDLNAPAEELYDSVDYPGAPKGEVLSYLKEKVFLSSFASDLPAKEARVLWAEQRGAAGPAFSEPTRKAAWRTIPSWSFISTGDRIISEQSKKEMATRAGSKVTVFDGGSHLSLISHPGAVTKVIEEAADSVG
jgi:pimeloyl-ACP methyl ester carboxylesterase